MGTMKLAWLNAKTAQQWHGKGTKREYFSGALKLAHKGYNLRNAIIYKVVLAGLTTFTTAMAYGALLAST